MATAREDRKARIHHAPYGRRRDRELKFSTSLELATACEAGAQDILLAYPVVGANARRIRDLSTQFRSVRISALVESEEQVKAWTGSRVGLFIDVNPGMDRTGIGQDRVEEIVRLARAIEAAGLAFRGVHYYDGHLSILELRKRQTVSHRGYEQLMQSSQPWPAKGSRWRSHHRWNAGVSMHAFVSRFNDAPFIHRASPGTVVYGDCSSLVQLPRKYGYRPAAVRNLDGRLSSLGTPGDLRRGTQTRPPRRGRRLPAP